MVTFLVLAFWRSCTIEFVPDVRYCVLKAIGNLGDISAQEDRNIFIEQDLKVTLRLCVIVFSLMEVYRVNGLTSTGHPETPSVRTNEMVVNYNASRGTQSQDFKKPTDKRS